MKLLTEVRYIKESEYWIPISFRAAKARILKTKLSTDTIEKVMEGMIDGKIVETKHATYRCRKIS